MTEKSIVIIGGGLAGLTAAIHLSSVGIQVIVIEKNHYPKHKVCGEYVSNEVRPYLESLGINLISVNVSNIDFLEFSIENGQKIHSKLPLGGFGISRYLLDDLLYQKAIANGCAFIFENVERIEFENDRFSITLSGSQIIQAKTVLGAFGKRSNIDQKMHRSFIRKKSPWLAVKAHYSGNFPENLVGLHHFNGGYCGVSKVESDSINICYLADYLTFKKFKNIESYQNEVLFKNENLKQIFQNCVMNFEKPLTISQISFEEKKVVENHVLMIGDAAGLIHPLCGNGMAMAIHSAKIVSEIIINQKINPASRDLVEKAYQNQWESNFKKRLRTGRLLASLLRKPFLSGITLHILIKFPILLSLIIKKTHGKYITLDNDRD